MQEATLTKHRDSNIELFRIVSMLLIVASHYNFYLSPLKVADPDSINTIFYRILGIVGGKPGIDGFILITGYFMCKKEITLQKYLKLLGQIWFYNIVIFCVFYLAGRDTLSIDRVLSVICPFLKIHTDCFISTFLVFFLTIPFVNALLHNLTVLQHRWLIILCIYCFVLLPMLTPFAYSNVNEMIWYDVLYIIAAYIKLHPHPVFQRIWPWLMVGGGIFLAVCVLCIFNVAYGRLAGPTNSLFALGMSVCFFMVFLNMKIGYVPLINHFGAATFGVILIHSNSNAMRSWLFKEVIDNTGHYYDAHFILYTLFCILVIYVVCAMIDMVRIRTVEKVWMKIVEKITVTIKIRKLK